jgi:hypothetical protein
MQVSNFGFGGGYIEGFGSQSGDDPYFEPLLLMGGRHFLSGLGRMLSRSGNNAYIMTPKGQGPVMSTATKLIPFKSGQLESPSGRMKSGGFDETTINQVNTCCFAEWHNGDCNMLDHFYSYCCDNCDVVSMMCSGMNGTCRDYLCGVGDAHLPDNDRFCLCQKLANAGIQSDNDWQQKRHDSESGDIADYIEEFRQLCNITIINEHNKGCRWANCGPILINLSYALNTCVGSGCPAVPAYPAIWLPFSASFCCLDYTALTGQIDERMSWGCEWLSKFTNAASDLSASCCSCAMHAILNKVVEQCNSIQAAHPFGC